MVDTTKIEFRDISFGETSNLPEHIAVSQNAVKVFRNNPAFEGNDEIIKTVALVGGDIAGYTMPFCNRLLIDGVVVEAQSGCTLWVKEEYRRYAIGAELFMRIVNMHRTKNCCFAGISRMAMPLYKVLKMPIFEMSRFIYMRHSRSVIHAVLKSESKLLAPIIMCVDAALKVHRFILGKACNKSGYVIEKSYVVPDEIEKIVMQDKHPFMELHDKAWFEWVLNNSFNADERLKKYLFLVKKAEEIEAFFVIKQEFHEQASTRGFKNVYLASVMEWGINKNSALTEKDIHLMAINSVDDSVDAVQIATDNEDTAKQYRRNIMKQIGYANMSVRIKSIKDVRLKNPRNWRLRLAASDTLLD